MIAMKSMPVYLREEYNQLIYELLTNTSETKSRRGKKVKNTINTYEFVIDNYKIVIAIVIAFDEWLIQYIEKLY